MHTCVCSISTYVPGLTILAYRYEGLRMSDFRMNIRALKEEMEEEQSGPYHLRPACQTLVRWVMLAGGTVRGVKKNHGGGDSGECFTFLVPVEFPSQTRRTLQYTQV